MNQVNQNKVKISKIQALPSSIGDVLWRLVCAVVVSGLSKGTEVPIIQPTEFAANHDVAPSVFASKTD